MGKLPSEVGRVDWLGCRVGEGASTMNQMLLKGATREQLEEKARGAVEEHLGTLRRKHGLPIWQEKNGKLRFDYVVLGIAQDDLA